MAPGETFLVSLKTPNHQRGPSPISRGTRRFTQVVPSGGLQTTAAATGKDRQRTAAPRRVGRMTGVSSGKKKNEKKGNKKKKEEEDEEEHAM